MMVGRYLVPLALVIGIGWYLYSNQTSQIPISSAQANFEMSVNAALNRWNKAPNDIQREGIRHDRDQDLCRLPLDAHDWRGKVERLDSYLFSNDYVSFGVSLNDHTTLRTEGDLQDRGSKISRNSPLFASIENLSQGDDVIFSGKFIKGENGCPMETSLTDNGSVNKPEFEFLFETVKKVNR